MGVHNIADQDQERRTPLHAAACVGDVHILDLLIESGATVNAKDHVWLTPLHRAAASRNERAVGLLLRRGAEANARDKFWQTPLHVATANRATRCAEALLTQLSNLNMADRTGRTALHHAAQSGFQEMVKLLLNKGANLSAIDKKERQPIHCAAYLGHSEIVKLLIDEPNGFGNTALHVACYMGQEAVATELVNHGANVNQPNKCGYTPLHLAAVSTNGALCLELLVNNGADVNQQSKEGKSPLHMAAIHGRFTRSQILIQNGNAVLYGFSDCCRKLLSSGQLYSIVSSMSKEHVLSAGFDINTPDNFGRTCLHAAASGGNVECLNLLLSSGTDLNKRDIMGRTPLHYAAANGRYQCTVTLVSAGAEVNEPDQAGCTPLHYSAASQAFSRVDRHFSGNQNQNDEDEAKESYFCLEHLLDNGADPSMVNTKGYSAVHYAAYHGNKQNLELLLEMSFNALGDIESSIPVSPLHLAADKGHWQALRVLTETAAYVDMQDAAGRSVLYLAAQKGFARCVEVLLAQGASCLLNDNRLMWTPIHVAASNGHSECLRMMIDYGEEGDLTNVADKFGQTPLMLAVLGGHTDCVHFLLEKGASPDAKDKRSSTSLHRGAVLGHDDCVSALLEHKASALCRDVQGRTPLHYAASRGHTEILANLVTAAVASDQQDKLLDNKQYTPLHWAAYKGHEDCLEVLLEFKTFIHEEGNPFTPLHCALMNGHSGAAERLLESAGVHMINTRDVKGRTPLHAAAFAEDVAGLQLVLRHGTEINAVDNSGCSALMVASDKGHSGTVAILLHRAKADLTLLDEHKNTALHLACSKAHEMCALLILGEIHSPTLINATNGALQMPLHLAARNGLATVVQALLSRGATVLAVDEEGHTPALACAPNKDVADCLALILSTMKPFPQRDPSSCSCPSPSASPSTGLNLLKHCGITAACAPLPGSGLHNGYVNDRLGAPVGLDGCLSE
ncbi:Serine/threonine-protein phosphatase 6 regulatory ankyrin repeat subunit C [Liparis tanakae]|uniref:Serine/threonine-protein phosphatase 6 regulatory ankyrin repeat subunit C n=1 Tax=Liparis tanakae TaxID=230148 RepID=A0A4Z2GX98_9TELE|nr:Serine/threonine-protein phosphatase 6 regulatory ankyrin repeat subunit C [Liparis tanakae]